MYQFDKMTRLEKSEVLMHMLIDRATGGNPENKDFQELRRDLVHDNEIENYLPRFVKSCRSLSQFWNFIQPKFPSYKERRKYIYEEFTPLLDKLESLSTATVPHDDDVNEILESFDTEHVYEAWRKARKRRLSDPEAAITSARTLLETVCKHILDEANAEYDDSSNLPKLYKLTAKQLNLAPEQHQEELFKQILGGCHSVVQGLGAIRNKLSDAHGKGRTTVKPSERHAALAVNLAGSMADFLVSTWQEKNMEK